MINIKQQVKINRDKEKCGFKCYILNFFYAGYACSLKDSVVFQIQQLNMDCEHPLAPRQKKYVRVRFYRSGWHIRQVPGRDACEITVVHQEDAGLNVEMAKLTFAKGIWSFVSKTNSALRGYSSHPSRSVLVLALLRLIKKNHEVDRGGRNTTISDSGHGRWSSRIA
ncbi:uncharacterized protein LOC122001461 isoform X5 [Zingiber officinale]|uniref:uncharacterized protein LOC122001461 isoform X5 n=1 Tax=Zingiber officinale TaxID=94328 RepID=UPI001C4B6FE5|nr:uncharacterized protein LOC122001461 isoform X5 [Zingiber officinale]